MHRAPADRGGNIAAFLFFFTCNVLANALPINGQTGGEVSAKYESLFTPAGFTFSIWGPIYLTLLAFVIYQALPAQRDDPLCARIDLPFKINCVANGLWIFAWHYEALLLSLLLILGILIPLIVIYRRLGDFVARAGGARYAFIFLPFSLYTAWVVVATLANISAVQAGYGRLDAGLTEVQWTWLKLALAAAIAAAVVVRRRDPVFMLVIAWAAFGIYSKHQGTPLVAGAAATISVFAVLLAVIVCLPRNTRRP